MDSIEREWRKGILLAVGAALGVVLLLVSETFGSVSLVTPSTLTFTETTQSVSTRTVNNISTVTRMTSSNTTVISGIFVIPPKADVSAHYPAVTDGNGTLIVGGFQVTNQTHLWLKIEVGSPIGPSLLCCQFRALVTGPNGVIVFDTGVQQYSQPPFVTTLAPCCTRGAYNLDIVNLTDNSTVAFGIDAYLY